MCRPRILVTAIVLTLATVVWIGLIRPKSGRSSGNHNAGSPELAIRWKQYLEQIGGPIEAKRGHTEVAVRVFPDGEWVMGLSWDSHDTTSPNGGTVVVRDSRGRTRAFFGHVCGPQMLENIFQGFPTLDAVYQKFVDVWLSEHELP